MFNKSNKMEVRFVKFNIRNFLEEFYLSDTKEKRQSVYDDFLEFYNKASDPLKKQVISYIRNSIIYKENQHIMLYLECLFVEFSN